MISRTAPIIRATLFGMVLAARLNAGEAALAFRQVEDHTGHMLAIPAHPKHVLSLCTSATDALLRLGAGGRLAAIDEYSRVVPGASNKVVIGKGSAIAREQVLALGIDLAFVWWFQEDAAKSLNDLSVPVVRIRCGRVSEIPDTLRLIARCINRSDEGVRLADTVAASLRRLTNAPADSAPRVYLELYGAYKTVGRDSFMNDLIELSGGRNIADDVSGSVLLSAERLMQADPDMILFVGEFANTNSIIQRSGFANLKAARKGRIVAIDRYWLVAGAGVGDAVTKLREIITQPASTNEH